MPRREPCERRNASSVQRQARLDRFLAPGEIQFAAGATAVLPVHEMAQRYKVNNRIGAYCVAINRVAEAVRLRGWA